MIEDIYLYGCGDYYCMKNSWWSIRITTNFDFIIKINSFKLNDGSSSLYYIFWSYIGNFLIEISSSMSWSMDGFQLSVVQSISSNPKCFIIIRFIMLLESPSSRLFLLQPFLGLNLFPTILMANGHNLEIVSIGHEHS